MLCQISGCLASRYHRYGTKSELLGYEIWQNIYILEPTARGRDAKAPAVVFIVAKNVPYSDGKGKVKVKGVPVHNYVPRHEDIGVWRYSSTHL